MGGNLYPGDEKPKEAPAQIEEQPETTVTPTPEAPAEEEEKHNGPTHSEGEE
jgi:hypothetical protein